MFHSAPLHKAMVYHKSLTCEDVRLIYILMINTLILKWLYNYLIQYITDLECYSTSTDWFYLTGRGQRLLCYDILVYVSDTACIDLFLWYRQIPVYWCATSSYRVPFLASTLWCHISTYKIIYEKWHHNVLAKIGCTSVQFLNISQVISVKVVKSIIYLSIICKDAWNYFLNVLKGTCKIYHNL